MAKYINKTYKVTDIVWDMDEKHVDLPTELEINVPNDIDDDVESVNEYISNEITNITSFCHLGFALTPEIF